MIDAHNFELSWQQPTDIQTDRQTDRHTHPQTHKHTHTQIHRQDRLQYTAPQLASAQCNYAKPTETVYRSIYCMHNLIFYAENRS